MAYYKQNRHHEQHFNSRHTTNRTDINNNNLIHDILQTEQTSIKHLNSRHITNRTDIMITF